MKGRRAWGALGLGLSAALLVMGPHAHAEPPAQDAEAEATRLYNEGTIAAKAGKTQRALDLYTRAWERRHDWQIAASLGRQEYLSKRYRDAAEHLDFAVREAPADRREAVKAATREMREEARAKVGALSISVRPHGAEVLVNGRVMGKAPLSGVVYVEPGPVLVEARLVGHEGTRVSRTASAGVAEGIEFALRTTPSPNPPPTRWPNKALAITLGSGSALLAAIGTALAVTSADRARESRKYLPGGNGCSQPDQGCHGKWYPLQQAKGELANQSLGAFIGAGALLLGLGTVGVATLITRPDNTVEARIIVEPGRAVAKINLTW